MTTSILTSTLQTIKTNWQTMSVRQRLLKEYRTLEHNNLDGINPILTENLHLLYADIKIFDNELYQDTYRVKIMIPEQYPYVSPVVIFMKSTEDNINTIPIHPHIYSNGHICLDLLGPAWTPIQTINSLLISLQSILASNSRNERPSDDEKYVAKAPKNPSKTRFVYHDETI
ncbi:Ubiquitin-conjugating enzyme E2 [Wickerhamomyces ciferrii]|uniref:Ubiquitin-conjugating enzyme E2 n=1 Tax=Wickerhamomyces ciferrii (strain ATCC 14091 / BCRC 22168 / CBS 111 / JCM 3599 / NBRC 0793 / NRRL Y-1031 F-60-10) TaxID=1206466 RepID=K0KI33_WICCF|nr:Ubiquitin-conjugating enzyme E2 [Wickerhamomyces ciferrii]CCH44870.1 Ubiquitin-conjugating enzyme E2 [Wickerhamomyces ciferrii]